MKVLCIVLLFVLGNVVAAAVQRRSSEAFSFFESSFPSNNQTWYRLGVLTDSADTASPQQATLWLDESISLTFALKPCSCGIVERPKQSTCQAYHYEVQNAQGVIERFPSSGEIPCTPTTMQANMQESLSISMIVSDVMIAFAYFSIPVEMFYYLLMIRHRPSNNRLLVYCILALFISFILLCGLTHIFSVFVHTNTASYTFQVLQVSSKIITAIVSCITAIALVWLIPQALALPARAAQLVEEVKESTLREEFIHKEFSTLSKLRLIGQNIRGVLNKGTILATTTNQVTNILGATRASFLVPHGFAMSLSPKLFAGVALDSSSVQWVRMYQVSEPNGATVESSVVMNEEDEHSDEDEAEGMSSHLLSSRPENFNMRPFVRSYSASSHHNTIISQKKNSASLLSSQNNSREMISPRVQKILDDVASATLVDDTPLIQDILACDRAVTLPDSRTTDALCGVCTSRAIRIGKRVRIPDKRDNYCILLVEGMDNVDQYLIDDVTAQVEIALMQADLIETEKIRMQQLSEQNEALQRAREQVQDATSRTQFLAVMSHEIRTPMYAVVALADVLMSTPGLSEEQMSMVETLRHSGDHLVAITNDILDFTKYEYGHVQLEQRPLSLRRCVEDAVDLVSFNRRSAPSGSASSTIPPLGNKSQLTSQSHINYFIDPSLPTRVVGDVTRLLQIFHNLLSNAAKFTEQGDIIICLRDASPKVRSGRSPASLSNFRTEDLVDVPPASDELTLEVTVSDTGIGIPNNRLPFLFDKFMQADLSTTRRHGGTGLGLAICHSLVNLMGGEIWVESQVGEGSKFTLQIKLKRVTPEVEQQWRLKRLNADDDDDDDDATDDDHDPFQSNNGDSVDATVKLAPPEPFLRGSSPRPKPCLVELIIVDLWPKNKAGIVDMLLCTAYSTTIGCESFWECVQLLLSTKSTLISTKPRIILLDMTTLTADVKKSLNNASHPLPSLQLPNVPKYLEHVPLAAAVALAALDELMNIAPILLLERREAYVALSSNFDQQEQPKDPVDSLMQIFKGNTLAKHGLIYNALHRPIRRAILLKSLRSLTKLVTSTTKETCPWRTNAVDIAGLMNLTSPTTATPPMPPLAQSNQVPQIAVSQLSKEQQIKILVVDDNDVNLMVTKKMLVSLGYSVELASSGAQAIAIISKEGSFFDVVFMDMSMPEMDGVETTKMIRRLKLAKQPWITALTANSSAEDQERCRNAGMNDFLGKPVKKNGLKVVIDRFLLSKKS